MGYWIYSRCTRRIPPEHPLPATHSTSHVFRYPTSLLLQHAGKDGAGNPIQQKQEMKTAYISSALDLIFAAQRFNNHRPYIMAGINPMMNLNSKNEDYIKLKKTDLFLELGLGCDFYLPYFKLRPELKFMYGITDTYDKNHIKNIKDKSTLPYTLSAKSAHSK